MRTTIALALALATMGTTTALASDTGVRMHGECVAVVRSVTHTMHDVLTVRRPSGKLATVVAGFGDAFAPCPLAPTKAKVPMCVPGTDAYHEAHYCAAARGE